MKAKVFLGINVVLYPVFCFFTAEINPFEWSDLLRLFYVVLVFASWYKLNKQLS